MGKKKLNIVSVLFLILILCVTIYFISEVVNILKLQNEEQELRLKNKELTAIRDELLLEYEAIKSKEYLENEARSKLKLVRPEELIIIYQDNE